MLKPDLPRPIFYPTTDKNLYAGWCVDNQRWETFNLEQVNRKVQEGWSVQHSLWGPVEVIEGIIVLDSPPCSC